jgi:phosphoglycerol transferase MdoB-like AlkP superfamily enzyme
MTMPITAKEKVMIVGRRHWVNLLPIMVGCGLVLIGMVYGIYWLGKASDQVTRLIPIPISVLLIAATMLAAFVVLIAALSYWVFVQSQIIVTNAHVIQINQAGLFGRNVQDVRSTKSGFWPTLLDYGDVMVDTSGDEQNFVFRQAAHPDLLANKIIEANKAFMEFGSPSIK